MPRSSQRGEATLRAAAQQARKWNTRYNRGTHMGTYHWLVPLCEYGQVSYSFLLLISSVTHIMCCVWAPSNNEGFSSCNYGKQAVC